tara:strand:- start:81 stop:797 length:717 start_codon:yes stop_codon:yes gene_type:complete
MDNNELINRKFGDRKIILYSVPRTGAHAVMNAFSTMGMVIPKEIQLLSGRYNHIDVAEQAFDVDGYHAFNIEGKQSMEMPEILNHCKADLVCLRRNDIFATIASFWGFVNGHCNNPSSHTNWTSTGKAATYDPFVIERIFEFNAFIQSVLYCNYLIDNVYPHHPRYLTTINYEAPTAGLKDLYTYLGFREVPLELAAPSKLEDYFINHEEFKEDIMRRLNEIHPGGLLYNVVQKIIEN